MLAITKDTQFQPTYVNFLQSGQFLDLPVKVDFTGKPVKQFYRFLPFLTSKNLQPYCRGSALDLGILRSFPHNLVPRYKPLATKKPQLCAKILITLAEFV